MWQRTNFLFRPGLEPLERKQPLTAGAAVHVVAAPAAETSPITTGVITPSQVKPHHGFLTRRVTQPSRYTNHIVLPATTVLVQARQPIPGQVYNVLSVAVRNSTAQTFTASSGFRVRLSRQGGSTPILTGDQTWVPGQEFIFYVLTKKYYPISNQVTEGFVFDLGGARSVLIPGPSGIFLRLKYNPATISRTLNVLAVAGQGAEGGPGVKYGLPDTAIGEFLSAKTRAKDFGGYF